jgi:tetratricopeptide (TPR) repeat protein
VLDLAPRMPEAQVGRAAALRDLGRLDEALAAAELALAARPEMGGAHRLRGRLLDALGRAAEAKASLAKAAELDAQAAKGPAS